MLAGTIQQLWRYPVKSMGGERIATARVGPNGIAGDRCWAVYDTGAGQITGAKRIPALLGCRARTVTESEVEIVLPGGEALRSGDRSRVNEALSELCTRSVTLEPLRPTSELEFYRNGPRGAGEHPAPTLNDIMGLERGDPLPDFSGLPAILREFATPPGTFFDAYALHIVTTASLAEASRIDPTADFDVRRFRPNIVIETPPGDEGFVEFAWTGRALRAGSTTISVVTPCVRCSMVMAAQPGLSPDRRPLRALIAHTRQDFGVYCSVAAAGALAVGDSAELLSD